MYRSASAGGEYVGINDRMINNTWYRDTDLLLNQTWYYRVSAINLDGLESALSGYVSATTGQIVALMSDYRGKPDSVVTLLINAENANGIATTGLGAAYGLDVEFTYDTEILTPLVQWDPATEVETVEKTVLTRDLIVSTNSPTAAGQINIVGYSTQTQGIILVGEGHLFDVKFHVSEFASPGDPALHTFTDVTFRDFNQQTLPVDFTDTATFTVASTYLRGDLTGDGVVDDDDVAMALMIAVGMITPTSNQLIAGDLNGDGVIDSADITLISRLIKGLPVNPGGSRTGKSQTDSYNLTVGDGTGYPADPVRVPIRVNQASGFSGVDLRLDFDPSVLTDFTAYTTPLTGDFELTYYYQVDSGWINIALSRSNNLTEEDPGDLVEIGFQVQSGARPGMTSVLHLAHKKLSGQFGGDKSWEFDVTSQDGLFQVVGTPLPTPTSTLMPTATPIPTPSVTPMATATPTSSVAPTATPTVSPTQIPIKLVKTVGTAPDGDIYIARIGEAVTFYYRVVNTGTGELETITITDDNGTPYDAGDDFIVGVIVGPVTPGAEFTLLTTRQIGIQYLNTAWARSTVAGLPVSASDDAMVETWMVTAGNDYNGDGTAYSGTWDFGSGRWVLKRAEGELPEVAYFGTSRDIIASGDYNGDGTTDLAIFRPATGLWAARSVTRLYYGRGDDIPIPGDYDGDGLADPGIYRGATGLWAIRGVSRFYYGTERDLPVPGDYDGNGTALPAIFRPRVNLWAVRGLTRFYFGAYGDYPVMADYDGDGVREIGIFRPPVGLWAIHSFTRFYFGMVNDIPQPADYRGDGTSGTAIYRPASGLWAIRELTRQYWGGLNNIPVN